MHQILTKYIFIFEYKETMKTIAEIAFAPKITLCLCFLLVSAQMHLEITQ